MKSYRKTGISSIKKSMVAFVVIMLSMYLCASLAFAQQESSNYLAVKGGIYSPTSNDLKGFSTGFNGEIAAGHYFNKYFASEMSVGYLQTSSSQSGSGTISNTSYSGGASLDMWAIPITIAAKGLYPMKNFEPYVTGGVGLYIANAKFNYSGTFTNGGIRATATGSATSTASTFGGFVGAGANYNIDKNWFLGVEGKYLLVQPTFTFYGVDIKASMDGWQVTGLLGYRF